MEIELEGELFPLPRFWFISNDDVNLLQVQRSAVLYNWRKRNNIYPHYEDIKRNFDSIFQEFHTFLDDTFGPLELEVARCELTYVNIIEDVEYFRGFADAANVIPQLQTLRLHEMPPKQFSSGYLFQISSDLQLWVNVQTRVNAKTEKEALFFELRANGPVESGTKSASDAWFERAHDAIGGAFNALTSPETQRNFWKPREA